MKPDKTAIIIGGGIGGLCAAIALRRKGINARVFEKTPVLKEVGAGLSLWVNAIKALDKIGVTEALKEVSFPQSSGNLCNARGEVLSNAFRSIENQEAHPTLLIVFHRAELLAALLQIVGEEQVILSADCVGFKQDGEGVTAQFADGREVRGDFLIGADGINSVIRAQLFGKSKPRYSGYTAWRAVTEFDHPLYPQSSSESWECGRRFGIVPISKKRVYWFAIRNAAEGEKDAAIGRKSELLDLFRGWHRPVEALIEATDESLILRNDIVDREPLANWTEGRVTLLGDAAHPMTPNLGQGACQAIEDAVVLADCVAAADEVNAALKTYQQKRLKRANRIVNRSCRIGEMTRIENPVLCKLRDVAMRLTPAFIQRKQMDWIINYEV
jgi:2-polyprenyl-6-methoxyphenol hydroxylase-like FAD-dependent oxidoreductase